MRDNVHFRGISFDPDFRHATRDDGLIRRFTKSERLLVRELVRHGGAVVSRDRLLDALSGEGSDASDRNVDFLINRLRRKLGDPARSPEFIGTHYGEGYSWIAPAVAERPVSTGAFLVVGPLRGLHHVGDQEKPARAFARELHLCLKRKIAEDRSVVLDPDCPPVGVFNGGAPEFAIDLNFLTTKGDLNCILTLTVFRTGQIVRVSRRTLLANDTSHNGSLLTIAEAACEEFGDAIWSALAANEAALAAPTAEPLFVRMKSAAHIFASERQTWREVVQPAFRTEKKGWQEAFWTKMEGWQENERRLRRILESNPDDSLASLMLAATIHSKWVLSGHNLFAEKSNTRKEDEDEMERLVTASLPYQQGNPELCLIAAKLLFFLDRGYRRLAVEIAEQAFQSTTALATSLTIVGQMRLYLGEIEEGLEFLSRAEELSEKGSEFHCHLMFVKISGYLAAADRNGLDRLLEYLCRLRPDVKPILAVSGVLLDQGQTSPEMEFLMAQIKPIRAQAILHYNFYIFGRLFGLREHCENFMRSSVTLFGNRFGYGVIPEEIREAVPSLIPVSAGERPLPI